MTTRSEAKIEILPDLAALARRIADWLLEIAIAKEGRLAIALSGGSTPRPLYHLLAEPAYRHKFPWSRTHWFWGDERFVPHEDPRSNYRLAWETLLFFVPATASHVHPVPTEGGDPETAAIAYERTLKTFYGAEELDPARPLFDVNLLGLGTNGHTASLFPGTPVLEERTRWVAPMVGAAPEPRITLTYPTLESSRHVAFMVAGGEKRAMFERLKRGDERIPAGRIRPVGELVLFADEAAGGEEPQ